MKKVIIGVVLLLALAGITVWVTQQDNKTTMTGELSDFGYEDTASVDRMVLKDESGNRIVLTREESRWVLNDSFQARPDAINILLETIKKVKVRAPISQQEMDRVLKNIISNHTLIEIYANGDMVRNYYVGGPDKEHTGTYMLMKGAQRPFLMHIEGFHGFLTPRYFTNTLEWRHRGVFEYDPYNITSIEVSYPAKPEKDFRIERSSTDDLEVFAGELMSPIQSIDSFMLSAYLSNYEMVHYESFEETKTENFLDSVKTSGPIFHIVVSDRSGASKEVTGFRKPIKEGYDPKGTPIDYDMDRLYLWIDSGEIVIGQYAIFDKLTQGIGFFKNR